MRNSCTTIRKAGDRMKGRAIAVLTVSIALSFAACNLAGSETGTRPAETQCQIDALTRCTEIRKTFSASLAGPSEGQTNAQVIRELIIPIVMPHGEPNIDIHCGIDIRTQSIAYARVAQAPTLTADDLVSLRSRGYCSNR